MADESPDTVGPRDRTWEDVVIYSFVTVASALTIGLVQYAGQVEGKLVILVSVVLGLVVAAMGTVEIMTTKRMRALGYVPLATPLPNGSLFGPAELPTRSTAGEPGE